MRIFVIISTLFFSLHSFAQQERLKGYIQDQSNLLPLHGAHIQNHTTKKLAISAPNGTFTIPASPGDSIVISFTGFKTLSLVVSRDEVRKRQFYSLKPDEVKLQDVVVTPFPEYRRFKQIILETEPTDSSLHIDVHKVGRYAFYDPRSAPINQDLAPPTVRIPFDLEGLTRRGKEKKKFIQVLEDERKWKLASEKFNREWLEDLTNLAGEDLTDFIAFCDFSADYILKTHLIDLKSQVMLLLKEFQSVEQNSKNDQYLPGA